MNLDVTSPAATLALGLMFLRTNDAAIAASFTLPDTHFSLDYVRPDFVMLRILARSLVMQEGVQASQAWVEAQMPPLIKVMPIGAINVIPAVIVGLDASSLLGIQSCFGTCMWVAVTRQCSISLANSCGLEEWVAGRTTQNWAGCMKA